MKGDLLMVARRFNTQPKPLIDAKDLADLIGVPNARAVYKRVRRDLDFPRPVRISSRSLRWRPEDVEDWLDGRLDRDDEGGGR
jgi:predicted DNA-binding transcriptional regulator AlpA